MREKILFAPSPEEFRIAVKAITGELSFDKDCAALAGELQPIFNATDGKYGFACVQVSPLNLNNPDKMMEYSPFKNVLAAFTKGLVIGSVKG